MRFLSERGTDEQYVEAVRAWLANPKGSWTHQMGAFLSLVAMAIILPLLITKGYERLAAHEAHPWQMISFFLAQRAGLPLALAALCLLWARRVLRGPRLERLMIRYHDELENKGNGVNAPVETAADAWIGSAADSLRSRLVRWMFRNDYAVKAQTDQECVALARASVKSQRRLSFLFLGIAAVHAVLCLMWLRFATSDRFGLSASTPWGTLTIGLTSGLIEGLMLCIGLERFIEARESLRHPRVARLMLRYHDAVARQPQNGEL